MDINHEYLLPLVERRHGGALNFILMEDNCGPHRAINVAMYPPMQPLHGLLRLDWAPQSPDINPIENVWSVLETRLRAQVHMPTVSSRRHVRSGMACRTVFFLYLVDVNAQSGWGFGAGWRARHQILSQVATCARMGHFFLTHGVHWVRY